MFLLLWVFSLPFVMVNDCGHFTPFIMAVFSLAFFGLDQVIISLPPFESSVWVTCHRLIMIVLPGVETQRITTLRGYPN